MFLAYRDKYNSTRSYILDYIIDSHLFDSCDIFDILYSTWKEKKKKIDVIVENYYYQFIKFRREAFIYSKLYYFNSLNCFELLNFVFATNTITTMTPTTYPNFPYNIIKKKKIKKNQKKRAQ
ncbi:hypothetical protein Glove_46g72 [Diversispora epigaea]|uniref:Uncharacterized protein n=1 Tax=Diversispora epigaea TaxID=1348612 RepID=A0A397JHJ5_9GLOM|nr:hypothetical protein Glove_46g72 [Diversispora epigaea]